MTTLNERVLAAVGTAASLNKDGITAVAEQYEQMWAIIQGPEPKTLTEQDAPYLAKLGLFSLTSDQTWERFKARMGLRMQQENDTANPYLPMWSQKAEGSQSPWLIDSGSIEDDRAKNELSGIIRGSTPALTKSLFDLFNTVTPVGPAPSEMMFEIADAMASVPYIFLHDRGASGTPDPLWRWGSTLCQLSFLGLAGMRRFFRHFENNEDLTHWAHCSPRELFNDIMTAREKTGYACGLHYVDYGALTRVLHRLSFKEAHTNQIRTPQWYNAAVALHVFKHVRYWRGYGSMPPKLFCAYRGKHSIYTITEEGLQQSMTASSNLGVTRQICNDIGLPFSTAKTGKVEWYEPAIARTLSHLHPRHIPEARPVDTLVDLIVPEGVRITQGEKTRNPGWMCPDVQISNIARVDMRTGKVDPDATVTGPDALAYRWPTDQMRHREYSRWTSAIPKEVRPIRASAVLRKWLRNLNSLGHPEALDAIIDSVMTLALMRTEIGGCPVGNAIDKEFPLVFVLPTGSTTEDTTNQGKTTLCRILAGALMPGVDVTLFSRMLSAPAQRSMMIELERFNGGILDEFILPRSPEHVLNQAGLQSLATGGKVSPGKAMENAKPFRLRNPLFFNAKVAPDVPDLVNRIIPIFLDALTPDTTLSDEALQAITSGYVSMEMRACHLMWMQVNRVRDIISGWTESFPDGSFKKHPPLKLIAGVWRFNAHFAVAAGLTSKDDISKYFEKARSFCATQLTAAEESGLTENIGYRGGFDPTFYFREADPVTLEILSQTMKTEHLSLGHVLRAIVEDGKNRKFLYVLSSTYNMAEKTAIRVFGKLLEGGKVLTRPGWRLFLDNDGRVVIERTTPSAADKLASDVMKTGAKAETKVETKPVLEAPKVVAPPTPPPPPVPPVRDHLGELIPGLFPMPPGFYNFAVPGEPIPHIGDLKQLLPELSDVSLPDLSDL